MNNKVMWLTVSLLVIIGVFIASCAKGITEEEVFETQLLDRVVSEKLIAEVDFSLWQQDTLTISPDGRRVVYQARVGDERFLVVDGEEGERYDDIVPARSSIISSLLWQCPEHLHHHPHW